MTDKQRKYAVKLYLRRIEENPDYSEEEFRSEVEQHINENFALNPLYNAYDPFALWLNISNLWRALNMTPADIVQL